MKSRRSTGNARHKAARLRPHRPGDLGWVVSAHGEYYAREFGYDETFEALVAEIAARFLRRHDPARERCWMAEQGGRRLGSVTLVRKSPGVAQLRLLIVDPAARGQGIGVRLVVACIRFARRAGYRQVVLWTQSHLDAARGIYERAGFRRESTEPHRSFGKTLIGEYWRLKLT